MEIVDLPVDAVSPAEWNPNEMDEAMLAHLRVRSSISDW